MKILLPVLFASCLLAASCGRDEDTIVAGKGGNATLKVNPSHPGAVIMDCMVYIEYNSEDRPLDNAYDDSVKCILENGKPIATFPGLKKGNYYLYGFGIDTAGTHKVKGGTKHTITEEKEQSINLPVSD